MFEVRKIVNILIYSILALVLGFRYAFSFTIPPVWDSTDWVRDYAAVLTTQEEALLEQKVHEIDKKDHVQIAIVLIDSLEWEDIDEIWPIWAQKRGVGYKKADNGIFILIAVKDRRWRIDVGYGLEGIIPDALAFHIGNTYMVPYFKRWDYYRWLLEALNKLEEAVRWEFDMEDINSLPLRNLWLIVLIPLVFATISPPFIVLIFLVSYYLRKKYNLPLLPEEEWNKLSLKYVLWLTAERIDFTQSDIKRAKIVTGLATLGAALFWLFERWLLKEIKLILYIDAPYGVINLSLIFLIIISWIAFYQVVRLMFMQVIKKGSPNEYVWDWIGDSWGWFSSWGWTGGSSFGGGSFWGWGASWRW